MVRIERKPKGRCIPTQLIPSAREKGVIVNIYVRTEN